VDGKEWMEKTGNIKRWILPLNELSAGIIYSMHDNLPEAPLSSCPWMQDYCVNRHTMVTEALDESDPRKFSLATPKRNANSYL
jgi:hypothetical protein